MKNASINLHIHRKRKLLILVSFSLLSALILLVFALSASLYTVQLNSLLHSKYEYSAITRSPDDRDSYLQFNAGISFSVSTEATVGINADVVMQSPRAAYSDSINWNSDNLNQNEIAITNGLAHSYKLKIGDTLFSKHIVNGTVSEYVITRVLPDARGIRINSGTNYSDGIIIMGYDEQYDDNVSHNCIVYTAESIEELGVRLHETPESILYRADEISNVWKALLPYALVSIALSIILTLGAVYTLTIEASHNFKRLTILGFNRKVINSSYISLVCGFGSLSIIAACLVSFTVSWFIGMFEVGVAFFSMITLLEFITLVAAAQFFKGQLWRK